jgi:hypothetical protein
VEEYLDKRTNTKADLWSVRKGETDITAYIRHIYEEDLKQRKLDKEKGENPGERS